MLCTPRGLASKYRWEGSEAEILHCTILTSGKARLSGLKLHALLGTSHPAGGTLESGTRQGSCSIAGAQTFSGGGLREKVHLSVQGRERVVQEDDISVGIGCASQRDALLLPSADVHASVSELRLIPGCRRPPLFRHMYSNQVTTLYLGLDYVCEEADSL